VSTTELLERIKALPKAERIRVVKLVEQLDAAGRRHPTKNRDLAVINRRAARLNREAADVLEYQISL
jgi:hypothetical protein